MGIDNNKNSAVRLPNKSFEDNIYAYPKSEQIIISKSDLQIKLDKFKQAVKRSFSIFDLLSIVSLWAPVISAEFKSIQELNPEFIKGAYIMFSISITFVILYVRMKGIFRKDDSNVDPEKMAQKILEQCQKKK